MLRYLNRLNSIPRQISENARLLLRDPERFGRNLSQVTNPALFEDRLLDVRHAAPMHIQYIADADTLPRLNVLDTAWSSLGMTGGPNTVINLACRIAKHGIQVRLVSTVAPAAIDVSWLRRHARSLAGDDIPEISVVSAGQQDNPLPLGPRDVFLATHWSTAQQLKAVLPQLPVREFFYMLQEFEPGFYAWSSNFALAAETYNLDFWPIINEATLAEFLLAQPLGRLNDPVMRGRALVFEPAVDAALFHPGTSDLPGAGAARRPRLLFYARPTNTRNLFGMGLLALRRVSVEPTFEGWDFLAIGSRGSVPNLKLGNGRTLFAAPWTDYAGYADLLRKGDLLLCPMLSPHTSYPVLEMAACGGLSVTNTFVTKTKDVLAAISENILAVPATIEGLVQGLLDGGQRVNAGRPRSSSLNMPREWGTTLDPVAQRIAAVVRQMTAAS